MQKSSFQIVKETNINTPESLMTLRAGETASVSCLDFVSMGTAQSAASRLNQKSGFKEFEISSPDNGVTICIHRNAVQG